MSLRLSLCLDEFLPCSQGVVRGTSRVRAGGYTVDVAAPSERNAHFLSLSRQRGSSVRLRARGTSFGRLHRPSTQSGANETVDALSFLLVCVAERTPPYYCAHGGRETNRQWNS